MTARRVCMLVRNDCRTDYRVLKTAVSVASAGYAVTVVAMNLYGPEEHEQRDGFEIIRVPVERAATKLGRGINLFPRALARMVRAARQVNAAIYHAHDSSAILPAWLAARQVPGAKLLYDAHEVGFIGFRESLKLFGLPLGSVNWLWSIFNDWIVRHRVAAVITVNEVLADVQATHYRIPRPAVVMNCPPSPALPPDAQTILPQRIGVPPGTPIVICQGMLSKERHGVGLENLVRSSAFLSRGVIVILGKGPQFEELQCLAETPDFAGKVFVLPAVPPTELLTYTCGAAIGVIPTEIWHPGLRFSSPNKLFEYLAVGLPVVTSDLPVIRRICEEYQCGIVCDPTSPASVAQAINRLLNDPVLYATMRAGALRAAQIYNWEHQEAVLLNVYRQLGEVAP